MPTATASRQACLRLRLAHHQVRSQSCRPLARHWRAREQAARSRNHTLAPPSPPSRRPYGRISLSGTARRFTKHTGRCGSSGHALRHPSPNTMADSDSRALAAAFPRVKSTHMADPLRARDPRRSADTSDAMGLAPTPGPILAGFLAEMTQLSRLAPATAHRARLAHDPVREEACHPPKVSSLLVPVLAQSAAALPAGSAASLPSADGLAGRAVPRPRSAQTQALEGGTVKAPARRLADRVQGRRRPAPRTRSARSSRA